MPTLQFWPSQPNHLLEADGRTLTAGECFEASEKDARELLEDPQIRKAPEEAKSTPVAPKDKDKGAESAKQ